MMRLPALPLNARNIRSFLILCFFVSGACGLVYEIVWLRILGLIFGNTTFATSTVLSGYMAGLGLGALYFGRLIDGKGDPIKVYGLLEGGVAAYALFTPLLWTAIDRVHIWFYRSFEPSFLHFSLFKFTVAFAVLIVPTFLMGGTLPVISKYFVSRREETAKYIGLLYGLNTLGAVLGVLFSGFIALYYIGAWQTVYLTAFLNLVIFYACYTFNARGGEEKPVSPAAVAAAKLKAEPAAPKAETVSDSQSRILLTLFGVSGAVSMMYEIGWTRILAIVLGSSVYAFSVMLATFLLGLALGSYFFSVYAKSRKVELKTFAALQIFTAITALAGLNHFNSMPYYFVKVYGWSHGSVAMIEFGKFLLTSLVMFLPTLAIGAVFSCFIHVYQHSKDLGHQVGTAYFANTIGTILGSALTGFMVIPMIGIRQTLMLASGINAAIAAAVFFLDGRNFNVKRLAAGAGLLGLCALTAAWVEPWNNSVITCDAAVKPGRVLGLSKKDFMNSVRMRRTLFYKEGLGATVSVSRIQDNISLSVNGKVDASIKDAFTQFLLGHLPMLLHPKPERICVIGLGSGSTLAAVASYPVKRIDCVELEEAVVEGARYFSTLNRNVLDDPRVKMHINDGRNYLLVEPATYDVIISEPSNPWMAGVANLFSLEHYRTMSARLNPGGIVCQWLHAYSMSPEDLQMIINTFATSFKEMTLWTSYYPDLMLIGTNEPLTIDYARIQEAFKNPDLKNDLKPHGIVDAASLFGSFWLGDRELRMVAEGGRINRDNHPYLEFSAPRNLYKETLKENFMLLNSRRSGELPPIINLEPPPAKNAKFYASMARGMAAKTMYGEAEKLLFKARDIDPEEPSYYEAAALLYQKAGPPDRAAEMLAEAIKRKPDSPEVFYALGQFALANKMDDNAARAFDQAVALAPEEVTYLTALANMLFDARQFPPALKLYDRILAVNKMDFNALVKMFSIIDQVGDAPQKAAIAQTLIERYPEYVPAYESLGKLLESGGRFWDALKIYQSLAEEMPGEFSPYINLARVYDLLGKRKESKKAMRQAVRIEPSLAANPQVAKFLKEA